jgi:hypothetical protein
MTQEEFTKINQELLDLRNNIAEEQTKIYEHKCGIELWDAEEMIAIAEKVDKVTNKPIYGNEERRKSELVIRKAQDNERVKLDEFLVKLNKNLAMMKAQEEFLDNEIQWNIVRK